MNETELKACPFCGTMEVSVGPHPAMRNTTWCGNCGCAVHADSWQIRPIEDALRAELAQARSELAALRERQRWVKVSERLPEVDPKYGPDSSIVVLARGPDFLGQAYCHLPSYDWVDENQHECIYGIMEWQPLPEPPEANDGG